jgi:pimeloyl-ACP methyl ester carboxylesterase
MGRAVIRLPRPPTPGVPRIEPPRHEGTVRVGRRRVLGYAEFGDPGGRLVVWNHGTPGARRQIPIVGRRAAERLGIRLVCIERPGVGDSTDHRYRNVHEWADDVATLVDELGHDDFAVVGLSGGGPYALACAAALAVIETIEADGLLDRATRIGELLQERLTRLQSDDSRVGDVRGRGAMYAVELVEPTTGEPAPALAKAVAAHAHSQGVVVLTCGTWGNVLRFLPPLSISDDLLHEAMDVVCAGFTG